MISFEFSKWSISSLEVSLLTNQLCDESKRVGGRVGCVLLFRVLGGLRPRCAGEALRLPVHLSLPTYGNNTVEAVRTEFTCSPTHTFTVALYYATTWYYSSVGRFSDMDIIQKTMCGCYKWC